MSEQYRGFTIQPKRDFDRNGFFIKGRVIREGFVVVRDGLNVMPAATWFFTVGHAKTGIDILIEVAGDKAGRDFGEYAPRFWEEIKARGPWEPPCSCQKEPAGASS